MAAVKLLLILLIVYLFFTVIPNFSLLLNFAKYMISCLALGIILYYLFRPLVKKLGQGGVPFAVSMTGVFLLLAVILLVVSTYVLPVILSPIQEVAKAPTEKAQEVKNATIGFLSHYNLPSYDEVRAFLTVYLLKFQQYVFQNAFDIVSAITHLAAMLALTPFTLFYFMKDDTNFHRWFISAMPSNHRFSIEKVLEHLDQVLETFFHGQIMIASLVTGMTLIALPLIGMDNIIFLSFITFFLSLIPYLGTLLAIIPITVVGLTESYQMAFLSGGVMTLIHLTESNIITPQVMMKRFDIHPLTIILLIMASFFFFGVLGPLWITPVYLVLRDLSTDAMAAYEKDGSTDN